MSMFRRRKPDLSDTSPMLDIAPFRDRLALAFTDVQIEADKRDRRLEGGRAELLFLCAEAARRWCRLGDEQDYDFMVGALYKMIKVEDPKES
jgi:hypothetical protein